MAKIIKNSEISDAFYPALHPQKSSQLVRDGPNYRNWARLSVPDYGISSRCPNYNRSAMYLPYHGHPHVMDFIVIRKVEVLVSKGFDCNTLLNEGTHLRYQDGGFSVAEHLNFPDHNKIHDMRVSLVKYTVE